jgi:SNF2 family DNA or RNA helicase
MPSLMEPIFKKNDVPLVTTSSKVDAVIQAIIARKDNGKGKIVFCHFRGEIDYISEKLIDQGLNVLTLDGRIKGKKRLNYLKTNADVMILQIQTGCEGLNLQQNYSEVYFVSPHWNPSIEDQAVARCHRIGQTKEVNVFRFIMSGFDKEIEEIEEIEETQEKKTIILEPITLEKYIQTVQSSKRKIAEEILF